MYNTIALERGYQVREDFWSSLDDDGRNCLERLAGFEAPYVKERMVEKGVADETQYDTAFTEFKKFVGISALSGKSIGMTDSLVDEVWHQFILFTKDYAEFCRGSLGRYMHHNPETSMTGGDGNGLKNLVQEYTKMYGDFPEVWNLSAEAIAACKQGSPKGLYGESCEGCGNSGCGTIGCTTCCE
jgi:hypothetical protein